MVLKINNVHIAQGGFRLTASLPPLEAGIYAVMGPSGAGKSSLLAAIAGFLDPCLVPRFSANSLLSRSVTTMPN